MKHRIYISGGITGIINYRYIFKQAEIRLHQTGALTVNPVDIGDKLKNPEYEDYMKADIRTLLTCDCIYMLKGWDKSKGARFEHETAIICGLKITYEEDPVSKQEVPE